MVSIALYQPDIPQNLGAMTRLCACLGADLHIIEPCGFLWDDRKIKRAGLDYLDQIKLERHKNWNHFFDLYQGKRRIILMSTKAEMPYTTFEFREDDILLAGRESAGVPENVHESLTDRVFIPMKAGFRSLNIVNACAMVLGEALRKTEWTKI